LYDITIPMDENGHCIFSEPIGPEKTKDDHPKNWKCCELCKALTDHEIDGIINIKIVFDRPMKEIRAFLHEIDSGCPHGHYTKLHDDNAECIEEEKELMGHPIQCAAGNYGSALRLL